MKANAVRPLQHARAYGHARLARVAVTDRAERRTLQAAKDSRGRGMILGGAFPYVHYNTAWFDLLVH